MQVWKVIYLICAKKRSLIIEIILSAMLTEFLVSWVFWSHHVVQEKRLPENNTHVPQQYLERPEVHWKIFHNIEMFNLLDLRWNIVF